MFQALKKIASGKGGNEDGRNAPPIGVQVIDHGLKKKFSRGVQYNMKVIIKGDRNTGKTCLWNRLQGHPFVESYTPTNEIQVANIHWNYKASDDVVKVEVWDVVDKGRSKKKTDSGLKLTHETEEDPNDTVLDAEFVNVYKGTNGVIMLFDITKPWTFQYIERELPKVPKNVPVLLLANCRDMGNHRLVTEDEAREVVEQFQKTREDCAALRYAESSMKNGYGLKYLYKYFNLPYLHLQRQTLLKQIQLNSDDIAAAIEELNIHLESEEQNYDLFLAEIEKRAKEKARSLLEASKDVPASNVSQANQTSPVSNRQHRSTVATNVNVPKSTVQKSSANPNANESSDRTTNRSTKPSVPNDAGTSTKMSLRERVTAKFFRPSSNPTNETREEPKVVIDTSIKRNVDVESFKPEEDLDKSFLEDTTSAAEKKFSKVVESDGSSDSEAQGNPLVTGDQDIDLEDFNTENVAAFNDDEPDEISSDSGEDEVAKNDHVVVEPEPLKPKPFKNADKKKAPKSGLKLEFDVLKTSKPSATSPPVSEQNLATDDTLDFDSWLNDGMDTKAKGTTADRSSDKKKKSQKSKNLRSNASNEDYSNLENLDSPASASSLSKDRSTLEDFLQPKTEDHDIQAEGERKKKKKKKKDQVGNDADNKDKKKKHKKKKKKSEDADYQEF